MGHWLIDAAWNGSTIAGAGGIQCGQCGRILTNADIMDAVQAVKSGRQAGSQAGQPSG